MNVDNTKDITVLSLCAGYGGLELGLAAAIQRPMRVVAVEVEAFALANLVAKTEQGKMAIEALWPDLKTFPAERFRGCFDIILAGYPCQPFSRSGKRRGKKDPRHLWPYIQEHIEAIRPICVFCENVSGHLELGFDEVYRSLAGMGYAVEAILLSAAECSGSHERQRLYILAYDKSYLWCKEDMLEPGKVREAPAQPRGLCSLERQLQQRLEIEPEPRLVRMADDDTSTMDRLRLLGNGVVPQCAEKAFRELWAKL